MSCHLGGYIIVRGAAGQADFRLALVITKKEFSRVSKMRVLQEDTKPACTLGEMAVFSQKFIKKENRVNPTVGYRIGPGLWEDVVMVRRNTNRTAGFAKTKVWPAAKILEKDHKNGGNDECRNPNDERMPQIQMPNGASERALAAGWSDVAAAPTSSGQAGPVNTSASRGVRNDEWLNPNAERRQRFRKMAHAITRGNAS